MDLAELYQQPLADFVAARNKLARESGDGAIKKLAKPSVSAWAVNQVWYRAPDACRALLQVGDRLLGLQRAPDRDAIAEATARKRELLAELLALAEAILVEGGHGTSASTVRKVQTAIDALGTYGSQQPEPGWGQLSKDLGPPGLAELAELAANAPEVELPERTEPVEIPAAPEAEGDEGGEGDVENDDDDGEIDLTPYQEALDRATAAQRAARKEAAEALIALEQINRQLEEAQARATAAHEAVQTTSAAVVAARRALEESRAKG